MSFDHIEHVRTVHATALILCFALLATSSLTREPEVEEAVEDLRSIYRVVRVWQEESVTHGIKSRIESFEWTEGGAEWYFFDSKRGMDVPVHLNLDWTALPQPQVGELLIRPEVFDHGVMQESSWDFALARPSSLAEFIQIWDSLDHLTMFRGYLIASSVAIVDSLDLDEGVRRVNLVEGMEGNETSFRCGLSEDPAEDSAIELDLMPRGVLGAISAEGFLDVFWDEARGLLAQSNSSHIFVGGCSDFRLAVSARVEEVEVDGQSAFIKTYGLNWLPGPFSRTFPKLNRVTKNYQQLSFDQLFTVLESELSRSTDSVEIFGAKIPSSEVFRWGMPAILAVQIYLSLHLGALSAIPNIGARVREQGVAWIGIYSGSTACLATIASAFLIPVSTVALIALRHMQESGDLGWLGWAPGFAAMTMSTLVALQSLRSWWRLRRFIGQAKNELV